MKRVYISVDIEGITGVTDWNETHLGHGEHDWAARQMTAEAAAACRGALAAGACEVLVRDAHDSARNIDGAQLPRGVRLIRGWECTQDTMMEEIDKGFDCAVCIGYHAGAGFDGNPLAHTINKTKLVEIRLNGKPVSELELNSYNAALYGVPILFVSGDETICRRAESFLPGVATVAVKSGSGEATVNLHPADACQKIEEQVEKAVRDNNCACPVMPEKFELEIRYRDHANAQRASRFPGARRVDAYTAGYSSKNFNDLLIAKMFMI